MKIGSHIISVVTVLVLFAIVYAIKMIGDTDLPYKELVMIMGGVFVVAGFVGVALQVAKDLKPEPKIPSVKEPSKVSE